MISQIVKKWQAFLEIQVGGDSHLECLQLFVA